MRTVRPPKKDALVNRVELEFSSLMDGLSEIRARTSGIRKLLRLAASNRSAELTFEAEVMVKNALRLLGEAMSHFGIAE